MIIYVKIICKMRLFDSGQRYTDENLKIQEDNMVQKVFNHLKTQVAILTEF